MEICEKSKCTGCFACVNACPWGCVSMQEDAYGEMHPVIDELNCRHCEKCKRVCPNNADVAFAHPKKCYASWIRDSAKRSICASGGVATILSEYVIRKGGVVYGTAYDDFFTPRVVSAECITDIEKFKGSKYVQSIVGEKTFCLIEKTLREGILVLFIGTPCQVAGLKCYLQKDYENLITADLICHGVCPTSYFKKEIAYIMKKRHLSDLSDIRFRGNDGKNYCLSLWKSNSKGNSLDKELIYNKPRYEQPYFAGFMLGVTLRENCYTCNYARPERIGDITLGDFLRLGKKTPFPYEVKQPSVVLLNNDKGETFYTEASAHLSACLVNVERDYSERLEYRPSLLEPFKRHPLYDEFRKRYPSQGFVKSIRSVLRFFIWKEKIRRIKKQWKNKIKTLLSFRTA